VIVDSYRFLPRSFRPLYEGRGPFPGEEEPVWAPFSRRLAESRIALLSSAGIYLKATQAGYDLEGERARPDWGDPTWRVIPASARPDELGFDHLHINDQDLRADPEIALPMRGLSELVHTTGTPISVMGYQDRELRDWRQTTAPQIVAHLREQEADGLILAPA
jgi:D-proline reductase (dithiol) PrdB